MFGYSSRKSLSFNAINTASRMVRIQNSPRKVMMSAMASRQELTREEIAQLRAILDEAEGAGEK